MQSQSRRCWRVDQETFFLYLHFPTFLTTVMYYWCDLNALFLKVRKHRIESNADSLTSHL